MPSLMIHLLTAHKFSPAASMPFWIGNIAPDSVSGRFEKDKSHFRDRIDRNAALQELALLLDLSDDYSRGVLLHLFLDYQWDSEPMHYYIRDYKGPDWFPAYRNEIALASGWLFHHKEWSKPLWNKMADETMLEYKDVHGITKENVRYLIERNGKWHFENNVGPSSAFEPDFVEEFTDNAVIKFRKWLSEECGVSIEMLGNESIR